MDVVAQQRAALPFLCLSVLFGGSVSDWMSAHMGRTILFAQPPPGWEEAVRASGQPCFHEEMATQTQPGPPSLD